MIRLAWATDVHLNFLERDARRQFYRAVADLSPDGLLLTGDVAESNTIDALLSELVEALDRPIYFVLGNHDFYRGSIAETRQRMNRLCRLSPHLHYLTGMSHVELSPHTVLVGHDGWADARLGNFTDSDVILNDYLLIEELKHWRDMFTLDKEPLRATLERLGDEAARHFLGVLPDVFRTHRRAVALMHVPPYEASCRYGPLPSDENWLPHFSCEAVGRALTTVMEAHAARELTVLCGHTHTACHYRPRENLEVLTGGAEYRHPQVQRVLELE